MFGPANGLVPIALFGWIPASVFFFFLMPARRALLVSILGGWMFLPVITYDLPGIPEYTKLIGISVAALVGAAVVRTNVLLRFRPRWIDLPMALFCASPFLSSMSNGLGPYDGISAALRVSLTWGIPYFLGRCFLNDFQGLRELAVAIFVAGLFYVPLCAIEMRLSPQLHVWVYGYHQTDFGQSIRLGGYRPLCFLKHGLTLGMFMGTTAFVGFVLWKTRAVTSVLGFPVSVCSVVLLIVAILCRSTGAAVLLVAGLGVFLGCRWMRSRLPFLLLLILPVVYVGNRAFLGWDLGQVVGLAAKLDETRARSLEFRIGNEMILVEKALRRPIFGWGGWGRSRVYDLEGEDISTTDGRWIIILGTQGLLGLLTYLAAFLWPLFRLIRLCSMKHWFGPDLGPVFALMLLSGLFVVDLCVNGSISVVFLLTGGALASLAQRAQPATAPAVPTAEAALV